MAWTILQPGVYVQNFDLSRPVPVPYDVDARFGFLDLADLGEVAATVLAERVDVTDAPEGLRAMFAYYDTHGLPAGTLTLRALLGRL